MLRRTRPALARIIASYSPESNLANLVLTLPRSSLTWRWGNAARTWHWRRRLEVPITLLLGICAKLWKLLETKASEGSSLLQMTSNPSPWGNSIGTSFIECTAISARPSSIALSNSLTKRPFPPTLANGVSSNLSPRVVIGTNSTWRPGWCLSNSLLTNSACHRANGLFRVAIRRISVT